MRFIAIKYLGSGWKEESIEVILDLFVFDYKTKQEKILYKDSEIWMLLTNWATLFGNMMSGNGQKHEFKFNSIKDLMQTNMTKDQAEKMKKDDKKFMSNIGNLSKIAGMKLKAFENKE